MLVFLNAIQIPSNTISKAIFESKDGKNFVITEEILTNLCLHSMITILKQAIISWIKVKGEIALRRWKYRIMF